MTKKEVVFCDGCNKVLEEPQDKYSMNLTSGSFFDGAETGYVLDRLDFCRECAVNIKETLHEICNKLDKKGKKK